MWVVTVSVFVLTLYFVFLLGEMMIMGLFIGKGGGHLLIYQCVFPFPAILT